MKSPNYAAIARNANAAWQSEIRVSEPKHLEPLQQESEGLNSIMTGMQQRDLMLSDTTEQRKSDQSTSIPPGLEQPDLEQQTL
jgi:hypothetical protein